VGAGQFDEQLDSAVDAAPDDYARLLLLAQHIAEVTKHLDYARQLRDATANRLRARGMPMPRIAAAAQVGDSYLSRRALAAGLPPRRTRRAS
jgi:hypothetical protein